jgi:F-type H+-transporting ATPase subunit epsilon
MPERLPSDRPLATAIPLLHLEIVTPQGMAHKDDVDEVVAPALRGEIGVLPLHRPLLAALAAGSVRWRHGTDWEEAAVGVGFLEIGPDKVILLGEKYLDPDAIDVAAAQADLSAADQAILAYDGEPDSPRHAELERDRAWAAARIDVASRRKLKI